MTALSLELARLDLSRESNIGLFEQLMRLSTGIQSAFAAAPPALKRTYLSLCWEKLVVRDRQIVEAFPTRAFAVAMGMVAGTSETAGTAEARNPSVSKKASPRLHAAENAEQAGSSADQMGGAVIKTQGWLPG